MQNIGKKIWVLSLLILTSMVIVSCSNGSNTTDPNTEDNITHTFDMDTVYYEGAGFKVTYGDLYNSIKLNDGIDQLTSLIDHKLLEDYFALITADHLADKRLELIYGTKEQEKIDEMRDDQKVKMEKAYENGMYVLGFSGDDTPYLNLLIARDLYVIDLLTNPDIEDNNVLLDVDDVVAYYIKNKIGKVNSILIKFDSKTEVSKIFLDNDLVEHKGELKKYTDSNIPLSDVPSYKITEENTRILTERELLDYFILFYNEIYVDQRQALVSGSSVDDLIANPDLTYVFEDLEEVNVNLGSLLFTGLSTMKSQTDAKYYTYKAFEVKVTGETNFYLALNLDRDYYDLNDFDGDTEDLVALIGQAKYDEVLQKVVDKNLSDASFVNRRVKKLREAHDLVIFDYFLKLDHDQIVPEDLENKPLNKSDFVIASVDGEDILVKDLLSYALKNKAPLYLAHASQVQILKSQHFDNVYCDDDGNCNTDYTQNNSGAMNYHLSEYQNMEAEFNKSQYASFYKFEDYLYLAYGVRNDIEMMENYIKRTLEPLYLYDYLIANKDQVIGDMMDVVNGFYDNYYSLNINHVLIYIDLNADGQPDKYEDFYGGLSESDKTAYDILLADLQLDIETFLADNDDDLEELVDTYIKASRSDDTWGEYKRYGIKLLTEDLSPLSDPKDEFSRKSLTYMNSFKSFEEAFVDGLVSLYQTYVLPENSGKVFIYNEDLVQTTYGLHLMKAEKGKDFNIPSAKFAVKPETVYNYPSGLNNTEERISASQIEVYINTRIFAMVDKSAVSIEDIYGFEKPDFPPILRQLMTLFVEDVHDAYYSAAYLNVAMINAVSAGTLKDNSEYSYFDQGQIDAFLTGLEAVYDYQLTSQFEK